MPDPITTTQVVGRLSQYRPFERRGRSAREAQEDLILGTLAERGSPVPSLEELRSDVVALFGIELDGAEIARSVGTLCDEGRVTKVGQISLSNEERDRLDAVARESTLVEEASLDEWRTTVITRWPKLSNEELERLEAELDLYLRTVLRRHGAEAALVLYPDDARASTFLATLEEEGFDFLPSAPETFRHIREAAFSGLLRQPSEIQRLHLARLLNTAYFLTVLSIDPEAAELVKGLNAGQRVYLDTNFIFRLLGIQGPAHLLPARTTLKRTLEAGYSCAITPWTVEEFQRSLRRSQDYLKRYPAPPSIYAELAAEAASEEDFVTAYWRKVKSEPGLKYEDFIALFSDIGPHLEDLGVSIESEGCQAIEKNAQAEVDLDMGLIERALQDGHGGIRGENRLRHDARHRLLVLRLRGEGHRTFSNAGYWFVTNDSVLPRYDFIARGGRSSAPPFCVSAGAWFQLMQAFRPKGEDLDQSLADLLASPYVRYRKTLSKESAQAIASRLALHENVSPQLAASMFMNSFLTQDIEASASPEDKIKKIDNAIVESAKRAQEEAVAASERAEVMRKKAQESTDEASRVIADAEASHAREVADQEERHERALADERERGQRDLKEVEERAQRSSREIHDVHQRDVSERDRRLDEQQSDLEAFKHLTILAVLVVIAVAVFIGIALLIDVKEAWVYVVGVGVIIGLVAGLDQLLARIRHR